jgi:ribonuclease P protein component
MNARLSYPRSCRLGGKNAFKAVYENRRRRSSGPLTLYVRPNALAWLRLGMSVSRRVGTAPRRNRIKRLLREAFRLHRANWPTGLDLVVVVRPHTPLSLDEYARLLGDLLGALAPKA